MTVIRLPAAPVRAAPVRAAPVLAAPVLAAPVLAAPVRAAPVLAGAVLAVTLLAAAVRAAPVRAAPVLAVTVLAVTVLAVLLLPAAAMAQAPSAICTADPHYWGCYAPAASTTLADTLPMATPSGPREVSVAQILGAVSAPSGHFYQDQGAYVARTGDRLLVGAAADNPALSTRDTLPRDWLSGVLGATSVGAWPVWGAQGASIARYGTIGFLSASRTSDARAAAAMLGYTPASIGAAGWCINDDTSSPAATSCYGGYDEAWRMPGVTYQPTFGREIEAVNFGGAWAGVSTPYHVNNGGGTYALQLGCGGGQTSGTADCDAALTFVNNPNRFSKGIVFGAGALLGTDGSAGDTGFAAAMDMSRNQGMLWRTPEMVGGEAGVNAGFMVFSRVTVQSRGSRIEADDNAVLIGNASGQIGFAVELVPALNTWLAVQGSTGGGAAGIYARGASANIGLYPAAGGELLIASPVTGATVATPSSATGGYLHINVNGADYRVPLFAPSQVGG